jgi:alpha-amylase/alpha-mannosidase (GH57 family)
MTRFVCIHGHFYQPPRENPWLEEVETEDSAYPYHDWNERITAECYAPNAASRILDSNRKIINITNNYAKISFNFGPTLLAWLELNNKEVYQSILEADKESIKRFSGHGSAIAQVYNHIIMPLANNRDKRTQVIWGMKDFISRFGRKPEGMWLPETAVDRETLEILAEQGILFTILSPKQANRVKRLNDTQWTDVSRGSIDTSMPYLCRLPSGDSIVIFFYDEGISQEIAFSNLLENGEVYANRMIRYFSQYQKESGLLTIASDGETYGHHHRFGDMALAYALYLIESKNLARITIYGEYLSNNPPTHQVEITENTSWSCPHGVERWRDDCGCCTPGSIVQMTASSPFVHSSPQDNPASIKSCALVSRQKWRSPLREAMDWLRQTLITLFDERMSSYVTYPWQARDDYIDVILNRSPQNIELFFSKHAARALSDKEKVEVLKLLEIQRNGMLMYTSCGWFFDDISGIESVQVMRYACRAMQLVREVAGVDPEPDFIYLLKNAPSNVPAYKDGAQVYRNFVQTSVVDLSRVGFHYALTSLIEKNPDKIRIKNYTLKNEAYRKTESGELKLAIGKIFLYSDITWEENTLMFAVLHLGNHNFLGGATEFSDDNTYFAMQNELQDSFSRSDIPRMIQNLEKHFGSRFFSLWDLFRDGQRKVLYSILNVTLADMESSFRHIYNQFFPLLHAMKEMQIPPPKVLEEPVWYIINLDLKKVLSDPNLDTIRLAALVDEMTKGKFEPDTATLNFNASIAITDLMQRLFENPDDLILMEKIITVFMLLSPLSLKYNLWECQNDYFHIGQKKTAAMQVLSETGDAHAKQWMKLFEDLGGYLGVKVV